MGYLSTGALSTVIDATKAASEVATDPHLSEITCQVLRLSKLERGQDPGRPCAQIPTNVSPGKGIGLRHVVVPVRLAVKARENPVGAAAVVGGVVAGIFLLGFAVGRRR